MLQIFLSIYFFKVHKVGIRFITVANIFVISLIPWWQGSLYSIGEIPSMILFVNALFLFNHRRRLSIILISFSIIYGKILTLLPFIGFYIFVVIKEKKLISILRDFGYFLLPILSWFLLIHLNYEGGSIINYINDQYIFISQHPSSGTNLNIIYTFWDSINNSEVSIWNIYDIIRIGIVPIIYFIYILLRQDKINYIFNNLSFFLLGSTFLPYIWFWFLSETKWMRYSQHFTVIILISLFYFLSSNIFTNRADLLTIGFLILIFIENYKLLGLISFALIVFILFSNMKKNKILILKIIIVTTLFLDITIPFFEKETFANISDTISACEKNILDDNCRITYLNE